MGRRPYQGSFPVNPRDSYGLMEKMVTGQKEQRTFKGQRIDEQALNQRKQRSPCTQQPKRKAREAKGGKRQTLSELPRAFRQPTASEDSPASFVKAEGTDHVGAGEVAPSMFPPELQGHGHQQVCSTAVRGVTGQEGEGTVHRPTQQGIYQGVGALGFY